MSVVVRVARSFKAAAKPLMKKYPSLTKDLRALEAELITTPTMGTPLGGNVYKIRLENWKQRARQSGGARIIAVVEVDVIGTLIAEKEKEITVNLIAIYDKADTASITDKELKGLIKALRQEGN